MIKIKLKVLLAMNDLTQKQLSDLIQVRPATISAMCNNTAKHLPIEIIDKICETLNCRPEDLLEYIPEKSEEQK